MEHVCIGKQKDYQCNQCEIVNLRADLTAALAQLAEKEGRRAIVDRDGKPVSQGAFNAMEDRYYLYGERMKEAEAHAKRLEEYMLKGVAFRDELQASVKELEEALVNLMKSADASWYTGTHGGHDWREAIDAAHNTLVKCSRRADAALKGGK